MLLLILHLANGGIDVKLDRKHVLGAQRVHILALDTAMADLNHAVLGEVVRAAGAHDRQVSTHAWLNQLDLVSLHFGEREEAELEEDATRQAFFVSVDGRFENNELECDSVGAQRI